MLVRDDFKLAVPHAVQGEGEKYPNKFFVRNDNKLHYYMFDYITLNNPLRLLHIFEYVIFSCAFTTFYRRCDERSQVALCFKDTPKLSNLPFTHNVLKMSSQNNSIPPPIFDENIVSKEQETGTNSQIAKFDLNDEIAPVGVSNVNSFPLFTRDFRSDLIEQLSRPMNQTAITWQSTGFNSATQQVVIQPFYLWRSDARVLRKLQGISGIRGTLHMKLIFETTPFHMGLFMVSHVCQANSTFVNFANMTPTRLSTMNPMYVNANSANNAEYVIPYEHQVPFIPVDTSSTTNEWKLLSSTIFQVICPLSKSDGSSPGTITITPYLWLTDIALFNETSYVATSSVKKGKDNVNNPMKASSAFAKISEVSHGLAGVPIIGETASIIGTVASGISGILNIFGFSKPTDSTRHQIIRRDMDNLALSDLDDQSQLLALTKSQSSDMGSIYLRQPQLDPLDIAAFCGVPAFLGCITLNPSDSVGGAYVRLPITPYLMSGWTGYNTSYNLRAHTPLSYAAALFEFWSGSLIFNFTAVGSPLCKGSILIQHWPEPFVNSSSIVSEFGTSKSCIYDISNTSSMDVVVHNTDPKVFSRSTQFVQPCAVTPPFGFTLTNYTCSSGVLNVACQTPLQCPSSSALVYVVVTIRAGPDFRLASPTKYNLMLDDFCSTSAFVLNDGNQTMTCVLVPKSFDYASFEKAFFGESVVSLRQLIKRYDYEQDISFFASATNGANNEAWMTAIQTNCATTVNYAVGAANYANAIPYASPTCYKNSLLSYITAAFYGYRGSVRIKAIPHSYNTTLNPQCATLSITPNRQLSALNTAGGTYFYYLLGTFNDSSSNAHYQTSFVPGYYHGDPLAAVAISNFQSPLEVTIPYSSNKAYESWGISKSTLWSLTCPPSYYLTYNARYPDISQIGCHIYKAAGDDYNVFGWYGLCELQGASRIATTIVSLDTASQLSVY